MVIALIVAGGPVNSTRMGCSGNKCFLELGEKPIISHTVSSFYAHPAIHRIIVSLAKEEHGRLHALLESDGLPPVELCDAASTRMQSIDKVLGEGRFAPQDLFLIHDGARPFVTLAMIDDLLEAINDATTDAAVLGIVPKDTIHLVDDGCIDRPLDRSRLVAIHTPVAASYEILCRARRRAKAEDYLDAPGYEDSAVIRAGGMRVKVVPSSYDNIKITTPEDILLAETLVRKKSLV